jgi:four helix bundle protein
MTETRDNERRDTKQETRDTEEAAQLARLDAWRLSDDLALEVFKLSGHLPGDLRWLGAQALRAATSVPANIAEGYSRSSRREFLQFLSIARGSMTELEYYLHFLRRSELIDQQAYDSLTVLRRRAAQTLFGLMRSLRASLPPKKARPQTQLRETEEEYLAEID